MTERGYTAVRALNLTWIAILVMVFLSSLPAVAQDRGSHTTEEARAVHRHVAEQRLMDSLSEWTLAGDTSRYIFLHMSEFWPHSIIRRGDTVRPLRLAFRPDVAAFETRTQAGTLPLREYVRRPAIDGLAVVHRGEIVFEAYPRMRPEDRHVLFSVSKTFVSTAVAVLEQQGRLDVTHPIEAYLPGLQGSGWEGVAVRDILDMSSGMACPIEFDNPDGCFQRSYAAYGFPLPAAAKTAIPDPIDAFAEIPSGRPPGKVFEYSDINTLVLTLLVESVSGKRFAEVVEDEIWSQIGAEADALMMNAAYGRAASPLGLSATLRDLARYGLLFTPSGRAGSSPVLSDSTLHTLQYGGRPELFARSSARSAFGDRTELRNVYQWDHVTKEGDLFKEGHGGQGLYISPSRDLVVAFFGTWTSNFVSHELPAVARQLATSGLFDE